MKPSREQESLATFFAAFGHKRRLMICDILLSHGPKGLSFEALQRKTGLAASTLSHHLAQMDKGGVLRRKQKGRATWLAMNLTQFGELPAQFVRARTLN